MDLTARRVDRVINRDTTGIECIKLDGSHLDGLHSARLEHRTTPVVGIVASTEGPVSWPPTTTHHSGGGQPRCWKVRELPHTSEVRYRLCVTSGTLSDLGRSIDTLAEERDWAAERVGRPFDRRDQLVGAREHRGAIDAKMAAAQQPVGPALPPPAPAPEPALTPPVRHNEATTQRSVWQLVQSAYAPTRAGVAAAKARGVSPTRVTPTQGNPAA